MKKFIYILFFAFLGVNVYGQRVDNAIYCSSDTLFVEPNLAIRHIQKEQIDSIPAYRMVFCERNSKFGIRFEIGVSSFHYSKNTKDWIGNHIAPNFNFIFTYDKLNFGFRFKPFTVNPKEELLFDGKLLTKEAKINPIKLDFYVGYSFDFKHFSVEPYLGLSHNKFIVINQDELNQTFSFPNVNGFINGVVINKYFRINKYEYIAVFSNIGYSIIDYKKVHNSLSANNFEWSLGVAYKGFFTKRFSRKIE
ncbi:hypothetical protein LJC16_00890 [Bacteroidales bacterium OttesenSCG-928-C19]|nr:hypothetical protein [Bacteroidales bacterium OttesenSCG-928-C19]